MNKEFWAFIFSVLFLFASSCGGPQKEAESASEEIILDDLEEVEEVIVEEGFDESDLEAVEMGTTDVDFEDRISEVLPENVGLLKGTDSPMYDPYTCDDNYIFGYIEICSIRHSDQNGNVLTILNSGNNSSFKIGEKESCFFKGLIDDKILVDTGTSNVRGLAIYDLSGKLLFETTYMNDISINGNQLVYWTPFDIDYVPEKPDCADSWEHGEDTLGFIAEYKLELNTMISNSTGEIDCQFME